MRVLMLLLCLVSVVQAETPAERSIIDAYVQAHQKRDVDALMALVEVSLDTPAAIIEQSKTLFQLSLDLKIVDVRVLPIADEDQKSLTSMLKVMSPTLEPVAKFVVTWDVAAQTSPGKTTALTLFLGMKDGRYRFATGKTKAPEPTPPSATPPAAQESRATPDRG